MIRFEHKEPSETVLILDKVYMYVSTSFLLYVCYILNFLCLFKKKGKLYLALGRLQPQCPGTIILHGKLLSKIWLGVFTRPCPLRWLPLASPKLTEAACPISALLARVAPDGAHLCPFLSNSIKLSKAAAWTGEQWGLVGALGISLFQSIKDGADRGLSQERFLLATIPSQFLDRILTVLGD